MCWNRDLDLLRFKRTGEEPVGFNIRAKLSNRLLSSSFEPERIQIHWNDRILSSSNEWERSPLILTWGKNCHFTFFFGTILPLCWNQPVPLWFKWTWEDLNSLKQIQFGPQIFGREPSNLWIVKFIRYCLTNSCWFFLRDLLLLLFHNSVHWSLVRMQVSYLLKPQICQSLNNRKQGSLHLRLSAFWPFFHVKHLMKSYQLLLLFFAGISTCLTCWLPAAQVSLPEDEMRRVERVM